MVAHPHLPAAVLWDMDGTLIDSEPYWFASERELAVSHGVDWTHQDALACVGRNLPSTAKYLQDRGVGLEEDVITTALNDTMERRFRERISWQSDAYDLLQRVRAAGIPCALVTASYRQLVDAVLVHAEGLFDVVVVGDEVEHGKPHPEPYLLAAKRLGVDITECVAVEDSVSGVESALASGAATIAIRRQLDFSAAPGLTRVGDLSVLTVSDLREIASRVTTLESA